MMSEVTPRELAVWSAYLGTALTLDPKVHDIGDAARKKIGKAKASIDAGEGIDRHAVADAAQAGIEALVITDEGTHPSRVSKVRAVSVNLAAVIEQLGGHKSGRGTSDDADDARSDGKVDCPCGKIHAAGSKVLARHRAAKG